MSFISQKYLIVNLFLYVIKFYNRTVKNMTSEIHVLIYVFMYFSKQGFFYKYPNYSKDIHSVSNTVLNVRNELFDSLGILSTLRKLYLDVYV